MKARFRGVVPPLPTIFNSDETFDRGGMARLLDHVIDGGVNGVLALGSTGEFCNMTSAMREEVAAFVVAHVAGRVPVMVGTGAPGTKETIRLTRHARAIGADAAIVINPYYTPLAEEHLFEHYRAVAAAVDLPLFLYNYPAMTGQDLSVELIRRVALACPNVVGIKESVLSVTHIREVLFEVRAVRPDFQVFCGYDEHLLNTLALGGDGAIPACANFAPDLHVGLLAAFDAGDHPRAIELHRLIARVSAVYGLDTPFYAVLKEALRHSGIDVSAATLAPTRPPGAEARAAVRRILDELRCAAVDLREIA